MYKVEVTNGGGSVFTVRSKDYEFAVDTKGNGVTPPDALLASLGSCMGVYIRKYAEGAKLDIGNFKIIVEADFDAAKPYRFKNIKADIRFENAMLDDRRKAALLEFIKNCPVHNTLKAAPDIEVEIGKP